MSLKKSVFKYKVPVSPDLTVLQMGPGKVLHTEASTGTLTIWAETTGITKERTFCVFGTGHTIPDDFIWQGTASYGGYVWHLYEVPSA